MKKTREIILFVASVAALAVSGCSPVTDEVLRSAKDQSRRWDLVQRELLDQKVTAEASATWMERIKAYRLECEQMHAALAEDDTFDAEKRAKELGIKEVK